MHTHRFRQLVAEPAGVSAASQLDAMPGMVACPAPVLVGVTAERQAWMAELYRLAFEQARRQVRPSVYSRTRTVIWN